MNQYTTNPAQPVQQQLKLLISQLTNKKLFRSLKNEIQQLIEQLGIEGEKIFFYRMLEQPDFKDKAIASNKWQFFVQVLQDVSINKQYSQFPDYFSTILEKVVSVNDTSVIQLVKDLFKYVKLDLTLQVVIAISLSMGINPKTQKEGQNLLSKLLQENLSQDKQLEFPNQIISLLLYIVRINPDLKDLHQEIRYLLKYNEKNKTYEFKPLENKKTVSQQIEKIFEPTPTNQLLSPTDILLDLGATCTSSIKQIVQVFNTFDINEEFVFQCLQHMINNPDIEKEDSQQRVVNALYHVENENTQEEWNKITNDEISDKKIPVKWDFQNFIEFSNNSIANLDWSNVMRRFDRPNLEINGVEAFTAFFDLFKSIKTKQNFVWPTSLFTQKWSNINSQITFLSLLIKCGNPETVLWSQVDKRKMTFDQQSNQSYNQLQPPVCQFWACLDILELLTELSVGERFIEIRQLFENPITKFPEILIVALSQIKPSQGGELLDEVFSQLFPNFLSNHVNSISILECIWKNNEELLISAICELYKRENKKENTSLNLSRVLDISQNIPDSLIKLSNWNDYNFSVNLGILAGKREFLHFDQWLHERLENIGDPFISALLSYLEEQVISQIKLINQKSGQNQHHSQKIQQYENILEKAQLNMQLLTIIFEFLTLYDQEKLSLRNQARLAQNQKIVKEFFPSLQTQPESSQETEKIANLNFQKFYKEDITIEDLIKMMKNFENSTKAQDKEVLACMITGLLDEYRFHEQYPQKELLQTGQLIGEMINHDIVKARALKIALDGVLQSLKEKKQKRIDYGIKTLETMKKRLKDFNWFLEEFFQICQQNLYLHEKYPEKVCNIIKYLQTQNVQINIPEQCILDIQERAENQRNNEANGINQGMANQQAQFQQNRQGQMTPQQQQQYLAQKTQEQMNGGNVVGQQQQMIQQQGIMGNIQQQNMNQINQKSMQQQQYQNMQQQQQQQRLPQQQQQQQQFYPYGQNYVQEPINPNQIPKSIRNEFSVPNNPFAGMSVQDLIKKLQSQVEKEVAEEIKNKITFQLNNLTTKSVNEKAKDIMQNIQDPTNLKWFSRFLLYQRIVVESQQHSVYVQLLTKIGNKELLKMVIKQSLILLKKMMLTEKPQVQQDKTMMKNLGSWIGSVTLSRSKPLPTKYINIKNILVDAFVTGKLPKILPVMSKILECSKDSAFLISSPWIQPIINVIEEIRRQESIQISSKVEILILYKNLGIEHYENMRLNKYLEYRKGLQSRYYNTPQRVQQPTQEQIQQQQQQDMMKNQMRQQIPDNGMVIDSLPEYVVIDRQLEQQYIQYGIDLKSIVARALDQAIQEVIPPVIQRSVTIALITTKELALKDFGLEPDPKLILKGCLLMVQKLSGSLALVTSREPLRTNLTNHLSVALDSFTNREEKEKIIQSVCNENLDIGCSLIRKTVTERAVEDVQKDKQIIETLQKRKQAQAQEKDFADEIFMKQVEFLPEVLRPKIGGLTDEDFKIYDDFNTNQKTTLFRESTNNVNKVNNMGSTEAFDSQTQEKIHKFQIFLKSNAQSLYNKTFDQSQFKQVQQFFTNIKNQSTIVTEVTKQICRMLILQKLPIEDKIAFFVQMLIYLVKTPEVKQENVIEGIKHIYIQDRIPAKDLLDTSNGEFPQIYNYLFQYQIIDFNSYQDILINLMKTYKSESAVQICVMQTLQNLQKLQPQQVLPVLEQLKENNQAQPNKDIAFFLQKVDELLKKSQINNNNNNSYNVQTMSKTIVISQELRQVIAETNQLFNNLDPVYSKMANQNLEEWLTLRTEPQIENQIKDFETQILVNKENISKYFVYVIDICLNHGINSIYNQDHQLNEFDNMDLSHTDQFSKFIVIILKAAKNIDKNDLLEDVCTSIQIVLTKWHESKEYPFHQRPFFKLIMNLIYDINRQEYQFQQQEVKKMFQIFAKFFLKLQPLNYPGFAFSWLELISSRYYAPTLLYDKDQWEDYSQLILALLRFLKQIINEDTIQSEFVQSYYKNSLRFFLLLLHDWSDFLSQYTYIFCDEIPTLCVQLRNYILASFPAEKRPPDPYSVNKLEQIEEFQRFNEFYYPPYNAIANQSNLPQEIENFMQNGNKESLQKIMSKFLVQQQGEQQYQIDFQALCSFTLLVPNMYIQNKKEEAFQFLSQCLKISGQYLQLREQLLNAIYNHLRLPNAICQFYISFLLRQFLDNDNLAVQSHLTRILFERLLVKRPHPWGLVYLIIELCRNPRYNIRERPYIKNKDMESIFKQLFKSIYPQQKEPAQQQQQQQVQQ